MSSYRRFVTYLFQYEDGIKGRNCGFAKVETRGGNSRIQIQVKGLADADYEVYLFFTDENGIAGIKTGVLPVRGQVGNVTFPVASDAVGEEDFTMDEMRGIYIPSQENTFIASQWDDDEVRWDSFRVYEKQAEINQEESRVFPPQQKIEEEQGESADQDRPEIQATQTAAAPRQTTYFSTWEQQWQHFLAKHPPFYPFDEEQNILAVKLDLRDFRILPKQYQALVNNSFLLHGYFNYKYLLLGYEDGEKKKWFLGIPGTFQNQEQLLAGLFGFPEFRTKHRTKQRTGEFGYWYRYLDITNIHKG